MASPNVFASLLQPVRSIYDYQQQLGDIDAQQAQLAQVKRKNALEDAALARSEAERSAFMGALNQAGGDQEKLISALSGPGATPEMFQRAQALQAAKIKASLDAANAQKDLAQAGKATEETASERLKKYRDAFGQAPTPQHAAQILMAQYQDPLVGPIARQMGPLMQVANAIPQTGPEFEQWKMRQALGMEKYAEHLDRQQTQALTAARNAQIARNDLVTPEGGINQPLLDAKAAIARSGASNISMGLGSPVAITGPNGQPMLVQPPNKAGGKAQVVTIDGMPVTPASADKAMTDAQAKANLFGTRAKEADAIVQQLAQSGVDRPSLAQSLTSGEGRTGQLATALATPQQQQLDQAQRDFINAVLRRESGAVISPSEFDNARKQYFVQPGDSPQVISQKARNRQTAIGGILAEVPEGRQGVKRTQSVGKPSVSNW